jgi:hypothetical protein
LAVVALDRELSNTPVASLRLGIGNQRGEGIRVVGFGGTEDGSTGVRKTRDDLKIKLLGKSSYADSSDPIPPDTFATVGVSVCNGDSGGPVFTTKNAVTGVVSHGSSCESKTARRIFTQVASYEDVLLRPAFEYVGHAPILEAGNESGAGGTAGEADAGAEPGEGGAPGDAGNIPSGTAGHGASDTGANPASPEKGGCACRSTAVSQSGSPSALAACALALCAVVVLRRRLKKA